MTCETPASADKSPIDGLQRALDHAGNTHSIEDVKAALGSGLARLWHNRGSYGVTEVLALPQKRVCRIWLAWGDMAALLEMEPAVVEWARENGCSEIVINGRKGWARVWKSYRARSVELVKEI